MRTEEESRELKERISKLSDEELLNMVEVQPYEYRKEALDYAKSELMVRGIQFQEAGEASDETDSTLNESKVMRRLTTCKNITQAGLLKGVLTASGIGCEIRGEYLSMATGELPFTECYPELWVVDDEDFERAKEIIDEWESNEVEHQESWVCQRCGEENEGQFNACWRCGWDETGSTK